MTNRMLGRQGENLAARHLVDRGHRVLARNHRVGRMGELDLVTLAEDGLTVCFIEVKARTTGVFGTPAEAVTADKRRRIRRMAEAFLAGSANGAAQGGVHAIPSDGPPVRFDVVEVEVDVTGRRARVHHIPDAF